MRTLHKHQEQDLSDYAYAYIERYTELHGNVFMLLHQEY